MDNLSLSTVFKTVSEGAMLVDAGGRLVASNDAAKEILGSACEGLSRLPVKIALPADFNETSGSFVQTIRAVVPRREEEGQAELGTYLSDGKTACKEADLPVRRALKGEEIRDRELVIRSVQKPAGVLIRANASPLLDPAGKIIGALCIFKDISQERASDYRNQVFRKLFAQTHEAVLITDGTRTVQYANTSFWNLTGQEPSEVLNRRLPVLQADLQECSSTEEILDTAAAEGLWSGELVIRKKTGELVPLWATVNRVTDTEGVVTNFVITLEDLTTLKSSQEQLYRLANRDPITGLLNRRAFFDQLENRIKRASQKSEQFSLMFLDLARFKDVNDSMGHAAGDQVLKITGDRLREFAGPDDVVARFGGDEFALLLSDCDSDLEFAIAADKVKKVIAADATIEGHVLNPDVKIGGAMYPDDGTDAETLAKNADTALSAADSESGSSRLFTQQLKLKIIRHFWLESELRQAFGKDQLVPFFQPQVNLANGKPEEAEVLIRWKHPVQGMISPGDFVPVAERTGLIEPMTREIIDSSCRAFSAWKKQNKVATLRCIAVNVSANTLADEAFVDFLVETAGKHRLKPSDVLVEITESSVMSDPNKALAVLNKIKEEGFLLAIDDFGTGYSSLSYLQKFKVDQVKIDQSFVFPLVKSKESRSIVRGIIAMCEALGLETLAEGVETKEHADILRELGCNKLQGYTIAKPLSPEQFEEFMIQYGEGFEFK